MEEEQVQIKFCCGCGFIATSLKDALEHARESGHTMVISGFVKPKEGSKKPKKSD